MVYLTVERSFSIKAFINSPYRNSNYSPELTFPALKTKIPFLTTAKTQAHKSEQFISDLNIPMHITVAELDGVNPPAESSSLYEKSREPNALLSIADATHYDNYESQALEQVANAKIVWF